MYGVNGVCSKCCLERVLSEECCVVSTVVHCIMSGDWQGQWLIATYQCFLMSAEDGILITMVAVELCEGVDE
jgi:hypothetical protein